MEEFKKDIEQNVNSMEEQNMEALENNKQFLFSAHNGIGIFAIRGLKNHFQSKVEVIDHTKVSIEKGSSRYANKMTKMDTWQISNEDILSINKTRRTQFSLLAVALLGIVSGFALHPFLFCLTLLSFFGLCKKTVCIQLKSGKDIWFYYDNDDTLAALTEYLGVNTGNMHNGISIYSPVVAAVILFVIFFGCILLNAEKRETPSMPSKTLSVQQTPEEFKNSCIYYSYNEIARQPQKYIGKPIFITGQIVQTIENADSDTYVEMRIDVEEGLDTIFYVYYNRTNGEMRFLEDDYVIVYGIVDDLITYESVQGANITIPAIQANYIEFFDGNRPY